MVKGKYFLSHGGITCDYSLISSTCFSSLKKLQGISWNGSSELKKKKDQLLIGKTSNNINSHFCLYEQILEQENPSKEESHVLLGLTESRNSGTRQLQQLKELASRRSSSTEGEIISSGTAISPAGVQEVQVGGFSKQLVRLL